MRMEFAGKIVVVTGAAMGIGRACAEAFHAAGATVVLADIDREQGEAAAAALGDRAHFIATDVRDMAQMEAMGALAASLGGTDILVNNAARALGGVVDEIEEADWQEVIDTNLTSVWRGMKVCVPQMRAKRGGVVVNMSSAQAFAGFKGWPAYAAAKGAINALTRQAAVDLAPAGIRVNAVAPGTILTPLNEQVFARQPDGGAALKETWNRAHPIGRFGYPGEVADAVLYLASDRASFVTGEILRVDGGLTIRGE
ncbi:SDR family oxidoreductase [Histidinibacterium lentulum]|uniref:SDR family oxidoreductase n=2 Tax=Histidinibacterium lentulum TaxID=2480588 RepID=A0A3N2R5C6_9RHOB|nr:SDR family oxidoreductase [Histidinibacterium lentulum]